MFKIELPREGLIGKDFRAHNLLCSFGATHNIIQGTQNKFLTTLPGSLYASAHNSVKLWDLVHVYNPRH